MKFDTANAIEVLEEHLAPLEYFLYPIHPPASQKRAGLWLLSAGWRTEERFAEYGRAVQNFSWSEFYDAYHGEAYFEWMRKQLNSDKIADVVLIDSRTGLTEMGGVCTRQLADVVVSFTAPNVQNLTGVTAMTTSFKKKEVIEARNSLEYGEAERPLEVLIVPTRIDDSSTQELLNFKREFTEQTEQHPAAFRVLKRTFWDLLIPYISKYAYGEKLAIGDEAGNERLKEAYMNLAAHLVLLAPEGGVVRARFASQLRERFRMLPRVLLLDDRAEESLEGGSLRQQLIAAGLSLWDSTAESSNAMESAQLATGNIDLAEFLVLPVKSEGVHSKTFQKQWRYARQLGVCVQLVRGDPEVELTNDDLPLWLREAHIYDPATELDKLIEILKRPCVNPRVPYMAPELPESYVPRPLESSKLLSALLNSKPESNLTKAEGDGDGSNAGDPGSKATLTKVALCGPAGSGKTALATAVCSEESVIAAFSDGVLWVTLGETPDIAAELNLIYGALTGETVSHVGMERILAAKLEGKKVLFVVNDVCNEADLRPFLDILTTGALLVTTRNQGLAASAGATPVQLRAMSDAESLDFIVKHSKISPGHEVVLNQIIHGLGNTPLAIKLAASALRQRLSLEKSPEEAVRSVYDETGTRGVVAFDQKNAIGRDLSVAKSISVSLSSLSETEKDAFLKLSILDAEIDTPLAELVNLWDKVESEAKILALRFASLSLLDYDPVKGTVRLSQLMHSFLIAQRTDPSILSANIEKAENVFSSLTPEEQLIAQRVLTRLVRLSAPEDKFPDTRRSYDYEKFDAAGRSVIKTLQQADLLIVANSIVQIADDSFVQGWNRFRAWLDSDRDFLTWRPILEQNVAEWESSKRHNTEVLLRGTQLVAARNWLTKRKDDLNESEKLFITESEVVEAKEETHLQADSGCHFPGCSCLADCDLFELPQ